MEESCLSLSVCLPVLLLLLKTSPQLDMYTGHCVEPKTVLARAFPRSATGCDDHRSQENDGQQTADDG